MLVRWILAVPCNCDSRLARELPEQKFSGKSARFQHKGNKASTWKQEQ
jgi:hypothetical protein